MFKSIGIEDVRNCTVPREEHIKRIDFQKEASDKFIQSVKELSGNYSIFNDLDCGAELPDTVPFASNPKWNDMPFGAANTFGNASCGALQTAVVISYFNKIASPSAKHFFELTPPVLSIIDTLVNKMYRSWKLQNKSGVMSTPVATLDTIKERFPDDEEVQTCKSLNEIFERFGEPSGVGTNFFWLDNVIKLFNLDDKLEIGRDTRISSVGKLIQNLARGIVVPIRVENSIYLGNPSHKGGHYVTWFAVEDGKAVIVDTAMPETCGIYTIPVRQVIDAIAAGPGMAVVWDVEPAVSTLSTLTINQFFS